MTCACGRQLHRASKHRRCHVCRGQHTTRPMSRPIDSYVAKARERLGAGVRVLTGEELAAYERELLERDKRTFKLPDQAPRIYADRRKAGGRRRR